MSDTNETIEMVLNPEVEIFTDLKNDPTATWTLLAYSGYLSLHNPHQNIDMTVSCEAKIPNREIMGIYIASISLWIKEKLKLDLKQLNSLLINFDLECITNVQKISMEIITSCGDRIAEGIESIFHSLIESICLLSICLLRGKKYLLSPKKKSGNGRIESIFYPLVDNSSKVIIHEYKFLKKTSTEESIIVKMPEAFWQVYDKIYLEEVITKLYNFDFRNVEVRAIVTLFDENFRQFEMRVESISHTMIESIKILNFFQSLTEQQLENMKIKFDIHKIILEIKASHYSNETIIEKLNAEEAFNFYSTNNLITKKIMHELGQIVNNKNVFKNLIMNNGQKLFDMTREELCMINGIGDIKSQKLFNFLKVSKLFFF
jgi:hypothetical protein